MKTVLQISAEEARKFFLKHESYCSIELPKYFNFQPLLNSLSENRAIENISLKEAKRVNDTNYKFLTNKDGRYSWRPLQLINPAIYVNLVHKITKEDNWQNIIKRFKRLQKNTKIICSSIPQVKDTYQTTDKATNILNWWQQIEQHSLELALDYNCFMNSDITDCYSAIYTHSIPWALHGKQNIKENFLNPQKPAIYFLGNEIDLTIQSMQFSQTNGIPQGSVLMDFIAEIILAYGDGKLLYKISQHNRIKSNNQIYDYQIIRYRDDYRIFGNNKETLLAIGKLLAETLYELNFKLNSQKTFISEDIIKDVVKPDKLYWNGAKQGHNNLQKHLQLIHLLAEKYPNSGSLSKALTHFLEKRIYHLKNADKINIKVLISILVDIAFKNPRTYPTITAIISKLLSLIQDQNQVNNILKSISIKFEKMPNVGHLQIWLQRLTLKENPEIIYSENLCHKVQDENVMIWNIDWLTNKNLQKIFVDNSIIDKQKLELIEKVIEPNEVNTFAY